MNDLTILIPTYNRKERLKQTLECLQNQTKQDYIIVIVDNCSSYCVKNLVDEFQYDFKRKIKLVERPYNIGSSANITMILLEATTKWCWLLGDDDYPLPEAVATIYKNMNDDICAMHFSVLDLSRYVEKDYKVYNLGGLIELYEKWLHDKKPIVNLQGDLIFMSNKVYNMEYIRPFIVNAIEYSYSKIGQLIPIFKCLEFGKGTFLISNMKIVESLLAANDHWNIKKIIYGMSSFTHISFDRLDKRERIRLNDVVMFRYTYVLKNYILDGHNDWYYVNSIYHTIYKLFLNPVHCIIYRMVSLLMEVRVTRIMMKKLILIIERKRHFNVQ